LVGMYSEHGKSENAIKIDVPVLAFFKLVKVLSIFFYFFSDS
jgi:hypothetical protein